MDEITIGDKTYISSKQAAKITGYAKDYVGQLCREGRVEARLVGRNWYVLDSAIREHRFGKEEEQVQAKEPIEAVDRVSTWQKPQYVPETPAFVPDLVQKSSEAIGTPAIADMQSAWREWFEEKKLPQEALPDGTEDFKDEYLPVIVAETQTEGVSVSEEAPTTPQEDSVQTDEMVVISRIRHQDEPEASSRLEDESNGEQIALHRSYTTTNTPRREYEEIVPAIKQARYVQAPTSYEAVAPIEKEGSNRGVIQALLIVVSVLAAVVAIIGTGNADNLFAGTSLEYGAQKSVIDFLGGKSTYESSL